MQKIIKTVSDEFSQKRLDIFIAAVENEMNRSKLKSCAKSILINEKEAKLSSKVKSGDVVEILWEDNIPNDIIPENIPLKIIYEDENVLVLNKNQGIVVHPAHGNWSGTLVNAILYYLDENNISVNENRPGIVHRLDKDTSGVMIVAKNRETEEYLSAQFKNRLLQKEYICITCGVPKENSGIIETKIARDEKNRQKFKAFPLDYSKGKIAVTIYHTLKVFGNYALLRVRIKTGRTHQIRVHLKHIGCPILGDEIYGKKDEKFSDFKLMLHARQMIIKLPNSKKYKRFKARLPKTFVQILKLFCNKNL